jgi:trans-2,3-dihydro-3-hydroxyanthranilate isomerase
MSKSPTHGQAIEFIQADVFTEVPFSGNPVAVFLDADDLSSHQMQKLAREMNLSESTFVMRPTHREADFRVRFFTPRAEIPFAGHPTLGTFFVLGHMGRIDLVEPVTRVHQEIGVGVLPVDLIVQDGKLDRVEMTQDKPSFHSTLRDISDLAAALGIGDEQISATGLPVQVVSTGLRQLMVPVRSLEAVQGVQLDIARLNRVCDAIGSEFVYVFTFETLEESSTTHNRMFMPRHGVIEDPASGSAAGALGAYLVKHGKVSAKPTARLICEQGFEIGRPSYLHVKVEKPEQEITQVKVGGQVVIVMQGRVRI